MSHLFFLILIAWAHTREPRFTEQVIDNNVSIGYGLALGDVDGDGKPDIILADKKQLVWYRNGDWKKFILAENITQHDNVCIAAHDIDGDGKVEIAVGAQWNPSETSDKNQSGAVFFLQKPADVTQRWTPVPLHHEPTTHRMRWVKGSDQAYYLVVLPLHGVGNVDGQGKGVKIIAYRYPGKAGGNWKMFTLDESLHLTHNFDVVEENGETKGLYVGGKEGVLFIPNDFSGNLRGKRMMPGMTQPVGEIRTVPMNDKTPWITTIQPMHGNTLVVYSGNSQQATILDEDLKEGHALGAADFLQTGTPQVVAGWRQPNSLGKTGIKMYVQQDSGSWQSFWIDENGMACEDLQVADLNGDGKPDIVAAGRATKNLKIYWNRSGK